MIKLTVNQFYKVLLTKVDCKYLVQLDSCIKGQKFNLTSGVIEIVSHNNTHILIDLGREINLEKFSKDIIKRVELEFNEDVETFTIIYRDGSKTYLVIEKDI